MPKNNPSIKERLAIVETEIKNLREEFNEFINNEFRHVQERLDWIFWIFLLGTVVSIALSLWRK